MATHADIVPEVGTIAAQVVGDEANFIELIGSIRHLIVDLRSNLLDASHEHSSPVTTTRGAVIHKGIQCHSITSFLHDG